MGSRIEIWGQDGAYTVIRKTRYRDNSVVKEGKVARSREELREVVRKMGDDIEAQKPAQLT